MIATGAQPPNQAKVSTGMCLSDPNRADEILASEMRGAAERHQESARRYRSHREHVQFDIQAARTRNVLHTSRQRWRVHYDQIELIAAAGEISRRLCMNE